MKQTSPDTRVHEKKNKTKKKITIIITKGIELLAQNIGSRIWICSQVMGWACAHVSGRLVL